MTDEVNAPRRKLVGMSALGLLAARLNGVTNAASRTATERSDIASGVSAASNGTTFTSLKSVNAGVLSVDYSESGSPNGPPVLLLHGWPYDIHSYFDVAPILAAAGYRVLIPFLRGFGSTRFLSPATPRNAQPAAVAVDAIAFLDALKIDSALLGGFDWGGRTANLMAFLWPQRCKALVSVSGYLVGSQQSAQVPLPPSAELQWWYQFYFCTERGKAGYVKYTKDFNRLIWSLASPQWRFTDATFERSATAFENPDFVRISLHNYRWRFSQERGESKYDELESKIASFPTIAVPTITMEGDANGAPHAEPSTYAHKYVGPYEHRNVTGGIGHNLPQEAPEAFAKAIMDLDRAQ